MAFPTTTIPPSSGGGGSSAFGDITGWPGASTDFVRGDGSDGPLGATDMIWAVTTTTRSTNAFSGDLAVAPASLATGLIITWRVPSAPSGASTYNLNSLGAKNIYRGNAAAAAGDLPANRDIIMRYDGTQWQIVGFGTLTLLDAPALQYFRASRITTDQTGSGSYAANTVAYNSVDTNEGTNWSNSSGVLTCNKAGTYLVTFEIYNSNATDMVRAVQVNNVQKYITWTATSNARRHVMTFIYRFALNDTLKLVAQASVAPTIAKDETFVEAWLLKEG